MARLTEVVIRNTRPVDGPVLLPDGGCLYLRVYATRNGLSRSWVVRIKRRGELRVHTVGPFPQISIKEARAEAARLVSVERGHASVSLGDTVEEYMATVIRPKYRRVDNPEVYARRLQARLGAVSLDAVRPRDVSRMISAYKKEAPVAAARMLGFVKQFFRWTVAIGYLEASPLTDITPAAFAFDEQPRERILSDDEIRALWHADDLPHRALLRFLLVTGLRVGEAQAAQAEWLDTDGWLHLPGEVMKNKKPHVAAISPLARKQIEADAKPYLFRAVSPAAVQAAVHRWQDRHGVEDRWVPHDLRRSAASRLGALGVPIHIIAKCLSHTLEGGGESTAVYVRTEWLDERKAAVLALAKHIVGIVGRVGAADPGRGRAPV